MHLYSSLIYRIKRKHMEKAIMKFNKINIDTVFNIIEKNCWEYGIQYQLMIKTPFVLEIILIGRKQTKYLRFHKTYMVFKEDYIRFESVVKDADYSKAYYITNGVFEGNIEKLNHQSLLWSATRVKLISNVDFLIHQQWLSEPYNSVFKFKKLDFYRYLPD